MDTTDQDLQNYNAVSPWKHLPRRTKLNFDQNREADFPVTCCTCSSRSVSVPVANVYLLSHQFCAAWMLSDSVMKSSNHFIFLWWRYGCFLFCFFLWRIKKMIVNLFIGKLLIRPRFYSWGMYLYRQCVTSVFLI